MKKRTILSLLFALILCMSFTLTGCGETPTVIGDGNVVKVDGQYEFEVEGWGYGDSIEGQHSSNSSYTYTPLDHIAYIELNYKNLGSETIASDNAFGGDEMDGELVVDGTSYAIDTYLPDDIVSLGEGAAYICYTVPKDIIEGEGEKIATFRIGEVLYQYNMVEGGSSAVDQPEELPEGVSIEKAPEAIEIKNGDVLKEDGVYECTVKGIGGGSEISDGGDGITYSYAPSDYVIWLKLDFKNLDSDVLEEFDCDLFNNVELVYKDEYNYEGGAWFANDIPALERANVYIYFEAPKEVYKSGDSKVATFEIGDTEYVYYF